MTKKEIFDHNKQTIDLLLRAADVELASHTLPLFEKDEKGQLQLLGTGVFLTAYERYFILTASHVLEGMQNREIYVCASNSITPIRGAYFMVDSDEEKDISFIVIPNEISDFLSKQFRALDHSRIELGYEGAANTAYVVIGYPAKNEKKEANSRTFTTDILALQMSKPKAYIKCEIDSKNNYLLNWWQVNTPEGKTLKLQRPNGMSGCGVWHVEYESRDGILLPVYYLIGIVKRYKKSPYQVFVATRMDEYAEFISNFLNNGTENLTKM